MQREVLQRRLVDAGTVVAGEVVGGVVGAFKAEQAPTHVQIMPGINTDVSLSMHKGVDVHYGPTLHIPNLGGHLPVLGDIGAKVDITEFSVPTHSPDSLGELAAVASQLHTSVVAPIQDALITHIEHGAGIGMVLGATVAYGGLKYVRTHAFAQALLREHGPSKWLREKRWQQLRFRRLGAVLAAGIIGLGVAAKLESADESHAEGMKTAFSARVVAAIPDLKGATISDTGGELISAGMDQVVSYIDKGEAYGKATGRKFDTALAKFKMQGGLDYLDNPDIVPMLHVSDIHCNHPYINSLLAKEALGFKSKIILNTGDTMTNVGQMPWEKGCFPLIIDQLKALQTAGLEATMITVMGNHDTKNSLNMYVTDKDGHKHALVVTLDKNDDYRFFYDGIPFVGDTDMMRSNWGPTQPEGYDAQSKLLAEQGSHIAKTACEILQRTKRAPIVLAHEVPAGYETEADGCATIVDDGHTHIDGSVQASVGQNGETVLQHTIGSAAGADGGITVESTPKQLATTSVQLYNKRTDKVEGFITVAIDTHGSVEISREKPPKATHSAAEDSVLRDFLDTYSKTWQAPYPPQLK